VKNLNLKLLGLIFVLNAPALLAYDSNHGRTAYGDMLKESIHQATGSSSDLAPANSLQHYNWSRATDEATRMDYDFYAKVKYTKKLADKLRKSMKGKNVVVTNSGDLIHVTIKTNEIFKDEKNTSVRKYKVLMSIARGIHRHKDLAIHVASYSADRKAGYDYGNQLSEMRAKSVAQFLVKYKVQYPQVTYSGLGARFYNKRKNKDEIVIEIKTVAPYEQRTEASSTLGRFRDRM